jgi:hypothetical protein
VSEKRFAVKCSDPETMAFAGYLLDDKTLTPHQTRGERFTEDGALREAMLIQHYGKYYAEPVKLW